VPSLLTFRIVQASHAKAQERKIFPVLELYLDQQYGTPLRTVQLQVRNDQEELPRHQQHEFIM
jgi:hypothetical protein